MTTALSLSALSLSFLSLSFLSLFVSLSLQERPSTAWSTCDDYPQYQCRVVENPLFYSQVPFPHNADGNFSIFERKLEVGQPNRRVWLISGGPGGSSDTVTLVITPQVGLHLLCEKFVPSCLICALRSTD